MLIVIFFSKTIKLFCQELEVYWLAAFLSNTEFHEWYMIKSKVIKYFWDQVWIYIHEKFTVYLLLLIYPLIFISVLKVRKKYSKKKRKKD